MFADLVWVQQAVVHGLRQFEQGIRHVAQRLRGRQLAAVIDHHVVCDGVALSIGNDARCRLHRHEQTVFTHQVTRVGVIGGNLWRDIFQSLGRGRTRLHDSRVTQLDELLANTLLELLRGLAGKRQTQDLFRRHHAVGHQIDHARSHRLGLARTGTRHHELWSELALDYLGLLRRRWKRLAQGRGKLCRAEKIRLRIHQRPAFPRLVLGK